MRPSRTALARLLSAVARAVCGHPAWFVYPQIVLLLLCVLYTATTLKLDMDRDHLIGPGLKSQQIHLAFEKEFPGEGNDLVVAVASGRMERNRQFVERLAARIKPESNLFRDLVYKGDLAALGSKSLWLASTNNLEEMRRSLRAYRPFIEQFSQATNLDSLFGLINEKFRRALVTGAKDTGSFTAAFPFLRSIISQGLAAMLRSGQPPPEIETLFAGGQQAEEQFYKTVDKGRTFLLAVRPANEAVTSQAIVRLRQLIQATRTEVLGVDVGLTGGPVLDYDEMRQAQHDTMRASLVAFTLCAVIFVSAYRQARRPLKAFLCLFIGLGYAIGFATLAIGSLNILSITFAPMLIGLAIDFGIHFITRYEEEMRNRRTELEAIERAEVFTGQGIVTGGLTTAAAFLAMALTHFKGIREMGIIAGGGLLLCLVPMMTGLPALLLHGAQNLRDRQIGPGGQRRLQIEIVWLRHPRLVMAVTLLLCLGAALEFHRVFFDYDLLHMQSQSLPSVIYEKRLIQAAGASSLYGAVIADSVTQARVYEAKLKELPAVAEVRSAADFLTPDQGQKLALIRSIKEELAGIRFAPVDRHPVRLESLSATLYYLDGYLALAADADRQDQPTLSRQLRSLEADIARFRVVLLNPQPQIRLSLTEFQQALFQALHQTFEAIQTQDTSGPLRAQDLPPTLRDRFIGITGQFLLQVYSRKDLWRHQNQREFIQQLKSVVPPQKVTGTPVQLYLYTTLLKNSYEQAAGFAFVGIVLMVLLHFRSVVALLLALLPVAVGAVWLLGFMGLAGIPFNPANIMTLPLMLGIGVTNGVQILNRFAEEQQPSILAKSTGKAVLVSGLTAIAGFGSLTLAQHQGIRSLGIVMSVGIAACMAAALAVLPALLRILVHWGWSTPRLGD